MYRWVEHTGEVELEIEAPTQQGVYEEAVRAMNELLGEEHDGGEIEREGAAPSAGEPAREPSAVDAGARRVIALEAPERSRLLADFLGEVAFVAETERFLLVCIERHALDDRLLEAKLRVRIGSPPHLVKAVTYHRLAFDPVDGGWRARVVVDV